MTAARIGKVATKSPGGVVALQARKAEEQARGDREIAVGLFSARKSKNA
jgi:hypothetical protein